MSRMIDEYLRTVETSLRVRADRKRQIVDELRSHLEDKVDDARRAHPEKAESEIVAEVLREFGNPHDLAVAYEPDGLVVRNDAGETLLRIGRAAARGTGKLLKWAAISFAVLLVLGLAFGVWAFYELRPYIEGLVEENMPVNVYGFNEQCVLACSGGAPPDTFFVHNGSREVQFSVYVRHLRDNETGHGTVTVYLRDPAGASKFNRTFRMGEDTHISHSSRLEPAVGDWSVGYVFDRFVGAIDVDVGVTGAKLRG